MDFRNELIYQEPLYEMSNLTSKHTGTDVTIWVSVKNANHSARVKVYKNNQTQGNNFSITISQDPKIVGEVFINKRKLNKVIEWVKLNEKVLLDYWDMKIDTVDMVLSIQKV